MRNLITAFAALLLVSCQKDPKTQSQPLKPADPPLIAGHNGKNAFNTGNLELQFFTIDAAKGGTVKGKNGTKLIIPKNAFVNAEGKPVTGKVTIGLKEAFLMSDIVFGGLATTSDGKILSTGGMLYIEAKQGEEKLELADSKAITTSVPTDNYNPEMLIFTGEQDADGNINWVNPVDIIEKEKEETSMDVFTDGPENNNPEPVTPVKPVKNTGGLTLRVNLSNPELLPEFIPFKDMAWKLVDESKYSKEDSRDVWRHVMVERSDKPGVYILTFKGVDGNAEKTKKLDVIPVFKGEDYEKAMAEYEKKYDAFVKEKAIREAAQKAEAERQKRLEKEQMDKAVKQAKAWRHMNTYTFPVKKMGWQNCDYFYRDKTAVDVIVNANVDNVGDDIAFAYLVFKDQKICIPSFSKEGSVFYFGATKFPLGIKATVIALSTDSEGNVKFVDKDVTIDKETSVALQLKASTKEEVKKSLRMNVDLN